MHFEQVPIYTKYSTHDALSINILQGFFSISCCKFSSYLYGCLLCVPTISKRSIAFIFKIFGFHLCLKAFHKLHDNALTIPLQPSLDCLSEPVRQDVSILPDKVSKGRVQDICLCPIFLRPYGPSISLYQF